MSKLERCKAVNNSVNTTILIVDDNEDVNQVIQFVLEQDTSWKIVTTAKPEKAMMLAQLHRPAVILLDVAMPELDGFELYRLLRSDLATSNVPIIFMTAMPAMKQKIEGQIGENVKVMIKPFEVTKLAAEIADTRDRYWSSVGNKKI